MSRIPKLKRTVRSFLIEEEGRISKKNLIKAGIVIASLAAAEIASAGWHDSCNPCCPDVQAPRFGTAHENALTINHPGGFVDATHSHCVETHSASHSSGGGGGTC
jgi:hypothetical protein